MSNSKRKAFRKLLETETTIMAPSAHDGVSARLIESFGFPVVNASGMAMAASRLGVPDIGLMTGSEVVEHAASINEAVGVPIFSDADTGYGNVNNVYRTVRSFETAGIAGIHLEDQVHPKKCGLMAGRALIAADEMVAKLKAAFDARDDKDFVIAARSDARGVTGVDEAMRRMERYLTAGADLLLVGEHYEIPELETVAKAFPGKIIICGGNPGMEETTLPFSVYQEWGIKLVIYPHLGLYSATKAMSAMFGELKSVGHISQQRLDDLCCGFDEFQKLVGLPEWNKRENGFH